MNMQMEQRTPEWYKARIGRITASRVGGILGNSPYQTRASVMRDMVREAHGAESEFADNIAVAWGRNNEAGALFEFELETELLLEPIGFVPFEDWAGISPDSFTSDGGGLEAKCPYSLRKAVYPVPFKTLADQPHYRDQVQFSLYVTGKPHWWFFQWCPAGTKTEKEFPDPGWQAYALPRLRQFYSEYLHELENNVADHLAPKRVTVDTPAAHKMVAEWEELCEAIDNATSRKADLLADMVALAGDKNADFAGKKLTLTKRAGSISYAAALKVLAPGADLERWRGKGSESWGLR